MADRRLSEAEIAAVLRVLSTIDGPLEQEIVQALCDAALRDARRAEATEARWLAFDIGCLECGEASAVIGTYATKEEAEAACKVAAAEQEKNWHGQHSFEVFDLLRSQSAGSAAGEGKA